MKKTFNTTQTQILFDILKSRNIPDTLLKTVDLHTQNKILIKYNSKLSKLDEIHKGVCQCCPLLPTLFNVYPDEIITKWQKEDTKRTYTFKNPATVNAVI
jgi:hypothetical protein